MSSNDLCQACMLLEKLNAMGKPKLELEVEQKVDETAQKA